MFMQVHDHSLINFVSAENQTVASHSLKNEIYTLDSCSGLPTASI